MADGSLRARQGDLGSVTTVDAEALDLLRVNHVHETLARVPGVWVVRGLRSRASDSDPFGRGWRVPVRAASSSTSRTGVPIRPAGFCNINNLFEVNTEQGRRHRGGKGPRRVHCSAATPCMAWSNVVAQRPARGRRVSPWRWAPTTIIRCGPGGRQVACGSICTRPTAVVTATTRDTDSRRRTSAISSRSVRGRCRIFVSATLLNQETGGFVRGYPRVRRR